MARTKPREPDSAAASDKTKQILQGAMREFLTHGYAGTSMDKVAKTGGVSKATVYSYFADKEGLFAALVQRLAREKVYPRSRIPKCDRQNLGILLDNYLNAIKSEIPLWLRSQVLVRCFS
jgi:AcrR family transcriptional regulator